jgi:DNA gyrase/topoisomerase IV subunit A
MIDDGHVIKWSNRTAKEQIHFDVIMNPAFIDQLEHDNQTGRFFGLIYRLPQDNLTVVMPTGDIRRFDSPIEYIKEFVNFRLTYYTRRKVRRLRELQDRIDFLNDLVRFIYLVINQELDFRGKTKKMLEAELALINIRAQVLDINVYQLTADHIAKHTKEIEQLTNELNWLQNTPERELYLIDLKVIKTEIAKHYHSEFVLNLKNEKLIRI